MRLSASLLASVKGAAVAKLVALIMPLSLDTFAVGAALGVTDLSRRRQLRLSLLFAGFEATMPLVGLGLGAPLSGAIGGAADYLAIGVLIAFGAFTLLVDDDDGGKLARLSDRRGLGVVALGLAVSLDELAIGFTLGLLRVPVAPVVAAIAVQAFVAAQLGLRLGARLGERVREGAERLAGGMLAGLGIALLVGKLLG